MIRHSFELLELEFLEYFHPLPQSASEEDYLDTRAERGRAFPGRTVNRAQQAAYG
jgi:hypothetical protein